ncbi:hypothetical protein, partial [Citrobacter youngae]|uniref:hypothetical protein n=1 Tax=Citrobacter youngae TaxID=133448 RepID=UPI001953634F
NYVSSIALAMGSVHNRFKTPEIPSLPRFTGGLVGYFGYETIYNFEHFAHRLKNTTKADPLE